MIARREAGNTRANLFNDSSAFVAGAHRERTGMAAVEEMNIAVTQPARNITNENFMCLWFVDLNVDDLVSTWTFE
jgi:hypothetical protein